MSVHSVSRGGSTMIGGSTATKGLTRCSWMAAVAAAAKEKPRKAPAGVPGCPESIIVTGKR
jgi:hypothetical protein